MRNKMPHKNREQRKEYVKKYYSKNKEWIKEKSKKYRSLHKEQRKEYYLKNEEHIKEKRKEYLLKNRQRIRDYVRNKYKTDINFKLRHNKRVKEYSLKNRQHIRDYARNKYKTDINFKLRHNISQRIRHGLKGIEHKSAHTRELLGCTIDELWTHLESQFKPWMTRENHGLWHIDHIRACAKFDLSDPAQQRECFHYSNLQPLWAHENFSKGVK